MLKIQAKGKTAEVLIYDDIGEGWFGGISAKSFADEIKKLGKMDELNVRINSYGGSVFDGLAIYNTLKKNTARIVVDIDGIAASIASIIAMAGDEIRMADNGFMMIHDPWAMAMGTSEDMRREADVLDQVRGSLLDTYMKRATISEDEISTMMTEETWLTAADAVEAGLADEQTEAMAIAAHAKPEILKKFKHMPNIHVKGMNFGYEELLKNGVLTAEEAKEKYSIPIETPLKNSKAGLHSKMEIALSKHRPTGLRSTDQSSTEKS